MLAFEGNFKMTRLSLQYYAVINHNRYIFVIQLRTFLSFSTNGRKGINQPFKMGKTAASSHLPRHCPLFSLPPLFLRHQVFFLSYLQPHQSFQHQRTSKRRKKERDQLPTSLPMAEPDSPVIHSPTTKKNNPPPKILSGFLYKAILFAIFVALLPLFPPQIPDSANHNLLSRTWELLHLLLVGIAVSYGLFSRRNADSDTDADKDSKAETPHSVLSRILQVPSMFDDDADADSMAAGNRKADTWSSQYQPADPVVVERKPLLLPIRSLKNSRVQASDSLRSSSNELKDSVVLPSPIPWRSRSGRMEVGDEGSPIATASASRTPSFRSAKAHSFPTAEMWARTSEDFVTERSFSVTAPPMAPPPPPPPPPSHSSLRREVKKSFKDELKDVSRKGREGFLSSSYLDAEPLQSGIPSSPGTIWTVRSKEAQSAGTSPVQLVEKAPTLLQQKYQTEKKKKKRVEFLEKMIVVSDDSGSEEWSDSSDDEEAVNVSADAGAAAEENEVDKKADEFIAKFREQIRLQRIESIMKSSGHKAVRKIKENM